jgi:hypothetical protein
MKRQGSLFEQIVSYNNIRLAFLKALRGNRNSPGVIRFCRNTDKNLAALRERLRSLDCGWGGYHSFLIKDPKPRVISAVPFEQRVMQHAIMNALEGVFDRPMIYHSYACRKNKGTHAAVLYAFKQCGAHPHFLKLDIRKYFDSVNHDALKKMLFRLIKDYRVLQYLFDIIDSYETAPGRGIPIGNLTSQFFANLYLAGMDHYILEKLRPSAYCRYMDDFVLWSPTPAHLRSALEHIDRYVNANLRLELKKPVLDAAQTGLPFLGFLIKPNGIYLQQKSKKRFQSRMKEINAALDRGAISEAQAAVRAQSVLAAIRLARTNALRRKICGASAYN